MLTLRAQKSKISGLKTLFQDFEPLLLTFFQDGGQSSNCSDAAFYGLPFHSDIKAQTNFIKNSPK